MLFITNTETVFGIIFSAEEKEIVYKLKGYPADFYKTFQIITSNEIKTLNNWSEKKENIPKEWFECKTTLIINNIGVKLTRNKFIKEEESMQNTTLFGSSVNIHAQPSIINIKDLELWQENVEKIHKIHMPILIDSSIISTNCSSRVLQIIDDKMIIIR